jgi:ribulose-phosphate 3-epimerase
MVQIIPAVLATTPEEYESDIKRLNGVPTLEQGWVHIDFMDNIFVPNQSIEPQITQKFPTSLKKEAHLMVKDQDRWIEDAIKAGFDRILIHFEAQEEDNLKKSLVLVKEKNIEVGLVINPQTEIEKIKPLIGDIDMILIMGVEPGFQGRPFVEETYERIENVLKLRLESNLDFKIAVDGGVRDENARKLVESGVDCLVVGSFLLKNDIDENLEKLWEVINS